jgi:adenine-specific DNA-methyltransferase
MGRVNRSAPARRRSVRYLASALRRFACEPASANRYDPLADVRQGRILLRRVARRLSPPRRRQFAEAITREITRRYWAEIQTSFDSPWPLPSILAPGPKLVLTESEKAVARIFGRAAARLDTTHAGYVIGTTYAALLPEDVRSSLGAYYTPPALAARLLDQATAAGVDWTRCSVLDPACGGGAFLAPVAERILKALPDVDSRASVREVESRIRGFDVDPFAAWLSQVFLEAVLMPQCRSAGVRLETLVEVKDALAVTNGAPTYDFVVGNPPYGRVSLTAPVRQCFERSLYGHANLYGLFTDLAIRLTRPGGIIAYVTPTSFFAGEYFSKLRSLLGREAPPTTVDFITRRKAVFEDVLQEALLLTCMRGASAQQAPVAFIMPIDDSSLQIATAGTFMPPKVTDDPWIVPRLPEHQQLTVRLRTMPHRLVDWGYSISTGPLVWNRHKSQLVSKAGRSVFPLV